MTPTPQERTELQRALELARWIVNTQPHDCTQAERGLAPALISLAAQSEELRAELEKERAYQARLTLNAAAQIDEERASRLRWQEAHEALAVVTEEYGTEIDELRRGKAALESRYSALVTALKQIAALEDGYVEDSKEAAQILTIIGNIVQDALAALTPKEGE